MANIYSRFESQVIAMYVAISEFYGCDPTDQKKRGSAYFYLYMLLLPLLVVIALIFAILLTEVFQVRVRPHMGAVIAALLFALVVVIAEIYLSRFTKRVLTKADIEKAKQDSKWLLVACLMSLVMCPVLVGVVSSRLVVH
jgi:MFS family permease